MCEDDIRQLPLFIDMRENPTGYLYALISHMRTSFKIGFTSRPPRRRGGELRQDGQMLCWWPGDRHDEQRLHEQLEPRLLGNREWYAITPDTIQFLIRQCETYEFPQGLRLLRQIAVEHFGAEIAWVA